MTRYIIERSEWKAQGGKGVMVEKGTEEDILYPLG